MTWIIDVHLVMFEVRELFSGEIQFVFGAIYCGAELVSTRKRQRRVGCRSDRSSPALAAACSSRLYPVLKLCRLDCLSLEFHNAAQVVSFGGGDFAIRCRLEDRCQRPSDTVNGRGVGQI